MADISKIVLPGDSQEYEIKDAKARMVILRYGLSTWQEFMDAYQNNCVIYCRASSNSNPATGSQTRLAFMAYVTDMTNPTNVEFQYYRSMSKHTDSQQGNQVYVYKLTNANKWTVTVRNTFSKVIAGDNLTSSFVESETNSSITLAADYDSTVTSGSTKLITSGAVYDAIASSGGGLSDDIKQSLLACFSNISWTCPISDTQTYYNNLREALYPEATLTSITCVYTQTHEVTPGTVLEDLRSDLIVTANFSDGSSDEIVYYTLSGTLNVGTSTVTVTYLNNTTTFSVTVSRAFVYYWDFTQSLVDQIQGVTANLRAASGTALPVRTNSGIELTAPSHSVTLTNNVVFAGKTFEFDIAHMEFKGSKSYHIRMIMFGSSNYTSTNGPLIWRYNGVGWASYNDGWSGSWSGLTGNSDAIINYMDGKTIKLIFDTDGKTLSLYIDDTFIETKTISSFAAMRYLYFGGDGTSAGSGDQCYDVTLSGVRIYENE